MILISHRGNLNGPNPERENSPKYIDEAIEAGYDVEIDIWLNDGILYLGHDSIQYETSLQWLKNRKDKLLMQFFSCIETKEAENLLKRWKN
jgi:aryl-phospho-beta-D-glucosidase BglC (GH1 family)